MKKQVGNHVIFSRVIFRIKNGKLLEDEQHNFIFSIETKVEPQSAAEKEKESLPFEDPVCITLEYFR